MTRVAQCMGRGKRMRGRACGRDARWFMRDSVAGVVEADRLGLALLLSDSSSHGAIPACLFPVVKLLPAAFLMTPFSPRIPEAAEMCCMMDTPASVCN